MTTRIAQCRCGQLTATCEGEPVRISVCHCLECQRRSGSAFAAQARFPTDKVTISGVWKTWERRGDSGKLAVFRFCPECGGGLAYENEGMEGLIAIAVGAFADPGFPPPRFSVWETRKHPWVRIEGEVEHQD